MHFFDIYYYFSHFLNWGIPKKRASSLITFLKNHESQSKEIAHLHRSTVISELLSRLSCKSLLQSVPLQTPQVYFTINCSKISRCGSNNFCLMYCVHSFKTREMRPSENFSFSIYPEKHVHQLLETRAILEPSQGHVMLFLSWSGYRQWPVSGVWIEEIARWRERSGKKGRDQGCLPFTQTTRVEILCINTKL